MLKQWLRFRVAIAFGFGLASTLAVAHDLPLNTVMNGFVKIEPHQAHLVVRVPMDLLRAVSFPTKGSQYELAAAGPATQVALRA